MSTRKLFGAAAAALLMCTADAALGCRLDAQQTEPPATARQDGSPACEQIRLGMTYTHRFRMARGERAEFDPAEYPRLGFVCPNSPAARAGLMVGDVILELNGGDFRQREVREALRSGPGTDLVFRIRRGATEREVTVRVPPVAQTPSRR